MHSGECNNYIFLTAFQVSHLTGMILTRGGNFRILMKKTLKVLKGKRFARFHRNGRVADVII